MKPFKNLACLSLLLMYVLLLGACKSGDGGAGASGEVKLQLNFKPGDKYLYTTDMHQVISYQNMANLEQDMLMGMLYEMKAAEGDNKKLSITYDHIKMKTVSPMGNMVYDSKNDTANASSALSFMGNLIGKSFDVLIAPDGRIVSVQGLDSMIMALSDVAGAQQVDIKNQFSDSSIMMMMQNSFDMYPGKPVKTGDTWTKNTSMNFSGFTISVESKYFLQSVKGDVATLKATSTMSLPVTKTAEQGIAMEMELKGTQDAIMEISISSGQIVKATTNQDIKGKIKAAGQEMPMDIKGTIKVSSVKQ